MPNTSIAVAAAALAAAGVSACATAHEPEGPKPGLISLEATGEVRAAPDMATVSAGVVAEAANAAQAMADQRVRMNAVVEAIRKAGVAERDIQTTGLDLSPVYAPYDKGQESQRIVAYRASNRVSATVRDLSKVGGALDALVAAGANTIDGVSFGIDKPEPLMDEARKSAVAKIRAKADLYAGAAQVKLGRLTLLSESVGWRGPIAQSYSRAAEFAGADAPTAVLGGELKLSVTVSATYEIAE